MKYLFVCLTKQQKKSLCENLAHISITLLVAIILLLLSYFFCILRIIQEKKNRKYTISKEPPLRYKKQIYVYVRVVLFYIFFLSCLNKTCRDIDDVCLSLCIDCFLFD